MLQLELDLKKGTYKNIYLFYGEETFLVEKYISRIKSDILSNEQLLTNYNVYDGKVVNLNHVIEVAKTAPFFANKRIIMLSNTTLFISSAKDSAKPMINFLSEHNNNYIIIFKESKVDKRSSLYKFIKTKGMCVEFNSLPEIELIKWTKLVFKSYGKDIENNNLVLLIRNTNKSMQVIYNEILKLVAYKTDSKITRTDKVYSVVHAC